MEQTSDFGAGYISVLTLPEIGDLLGGNSFPLGPGVLLTPLGTIASFIPPVEPLTEFIHKPTTYALISTLLSGLVHSALTAIQITKHLNCDQSLFLMLTPDYNTPDYKMYSLDNRYRGYTFGPDAHTLGNKDIEKAREVLRIIGTLRRPSRLALAITLFENAHTSAVNEIRLLMLFACLEALFGAGEQEITHQIAERASLFLEDTPIMRSDRYAKLKKLYNIRSKIIHGATLELKGALFEGIANQSDKMKTAIYYTDETARLSLCRILESESMTNLFSDERTAMETHFQKWLFGETPTKGNSDGI